MANCGGRCNLDGCDKSIYSYKADPAGLCQHHHLVWRRFGTTEAGYEEMFWSLVDRSSDRTECWPWLGATDHGYGIWHTLAQAIPGAPRWAHRISYEFAFGPIATGLEIDHTCYRIDCVNPSHLRPITVKQNRENRQGADSDNAVGIRGVTYTSGRYLARVGHDGKSVYCGIFDTPEEAGQAARLKRLELHTHSDSDRRVGS